MPRGAIRTLFVLLLFCAVGLTYANHFENGFHFDDFHSITDNVFIRDLKNVPKFFTDPATSSMLPANRAWRPIVTLSLAIDYRLGRGYAPFYFHSSTFLWFLVLLALMLALFASVVRRCWPQGPSFWIAWFSVAWYALHPAMAETVNYVIQRAEVISTCGVVAAVAFYAALPNLRRYHLYLVPALVGVLAKPPALIFPLLLLTYIFVVEEQAETRKLAAVLRRTAPAIGLMVLLAILQTAMTPKTFVAGAVSGFGYRITQPYVAFRYFSSFFLPLHLSADTDLMPLSSIWTLEVFGGMLFLVSLGILIVRTARRSETRSIAFGLSWFVVALIPTSAFPLAEVENDHRMFFPFVGLSLAVLSAAGLLAQRLPERTRREIMAAALSCLLLLALGTHRRNQVWRTEESLWQDVAMKSPHNGRGLMNYGLTQMTKGDTQKALLLFEQAGIYSPNYPLLEINLGIANAALHQDREASLHFRRAIELNPQLADGYFYYGRWLAGQDHREEAITQFRTAIAKNPQLLDARYLLMAAYAQTDQWSELGLLAEDTLKISPGDQVARGYARAQPDRSVTPVSVKASLQTRESFLELSLEQYRAGNYLGSIDAANQALRVDPNYAEAYNNIAAAYAAEGNWDSAVAAAEQAVRLKPDFSLARNNLAWAQSHLRVTVPARHSP